MPEAPDLEVVREVLTERAVGARVSSARVVRPGVLRSLKGELASDVEGRRLTGVQRRGKFLLLTLTGDRMLVFNPKLTGALQLCGPETRLLKRTYIVLPLSNRRELRYVDHRQMGFVYYVDPSQLHQVPQLAEQGPDVLDDALTFEEFQQRLRPFRGEIKGVLTRGRAVSGIGNAYSDEILFAARVYPFRKRSALTTEELTRIHRSSRKVVREAVEVLRRRMGETTHTKVRDFLKVHNRGGEPCPNCGSAISQITANRRITSYCRRCQPGMLIRQ